MMNNNMREAVKVLREMNMKNFMLVSEDEMISVGSSETINKLVDCYYGVGNKIPHCSEYIEEEHTDLDKAKYFIQDVRKLAMNYGLNFFMVTDGASVTSNGVYNNAPNAAVKAARESHKKWEMAHGYNPYEDWDDINDIVNDIKNNTKDWSSLDDPATLADKSWWSEMPDEYFDDELFNETLRSKIMRNIVDYDNIPHNDELSFATIAKDNSIVDVNIDNIDFIEIYEPCIKHGMPSKKLAKKYTNKNGEWLYESFSTGKTFSVSEESMLNSIRILFGNNNHDTLIAMTKDEKFASYRELFIKEWRR